MISNEKSDEGERFCFMVEWFDQHAQLTRQYLLSFCPADETVEMYDCKNRKTFLKRTRIEGISLSDFYIGAAVNIYSRQLVVVGWGDLYTSRSLGEKLESSICIIGPLGYANMGQIIDSILAAGFHLSGLRMLDVSQLKGSLESVSYVPYTNHRKQATPSNSGSRVLAVKVNKQGALVELEKLVNASPALFASSQITKNAEEAEKLSNVIFSGSNVKRTAQFKNSTLAIIRPHIFNSGQVGKVIDAILKAGFLITDLENFHLETANAEEFLEVYKDVVPEYRAMLDQLTAGQVVAMEIGGQKENIVQEFREFCGPNDPELARHLRPKSLRALFGQDKIKNGIHCTDLPDDGELEVDYFFNLLVS